MSLEFIVLLVAAVVAATIVVVAFSCYRLNRRECLEDEEERRRIQEVVLEPLEMAEAGDPIARKHVSKYRADFSKKFRLDDAVTKRLVAVSRLQGEKDSYERGLAEAGKLNFQRIATAFSTRGRLEVAIATAKLLKPGLYENNWRRLSKVVGLSFDEAQAAVRTAAEEYCSELMQAVEQSRDAMIELQMLVKSNASNQSSLHQQLIEVGIRLPWPDKWDELIALHYANPSISDFRPIGELALGELRLKAATALRRPDAVLAKILLAYAHHQWLPEREKRLMELGPLAGELAKLVDRYNSEHGLIPDEVDAEMPS